ncbi:MAG: response regulator [Verrucomicrobiota bacterium]
MQKQNKVLIVDDDKVVREILHLMLGKHKYLTSEASSGREAINILSNYETEPYDCVITDNHMADIDGYELIKWTKTNIPELATIMMTSDNESATVRKVFKGGAVDFLRKPPQVHSLLNSVSKAIEITDSKRSAFAKQEALAEINEFQRYLVENIPEDLPFDIELFNHPKNEIGGDAMTFFPISEQETIIILIDVSGHDLKAGFISTFFRGILRGMLENGSDILDIIKYFNTYLLREWGKQLGNQADLPTVTTSLCLTAILIEHKNNCDFKATVINSGLPSIKFCKPDGNEMVITKEGSCPLGWFDELELETFELDLDKGSSLLLWSDGIEDLALSSGVDPFAMAYHLLYCKEQALDSPYLKNPPDDISLLRISIPISLFNSDNVYIPILSETHEGDRGNKIDEIQEVWNQSIRLAIPTIKEDKLLDILLCIRELAINAFEHGCQGKADKNFRIQISYNYENSLLKILINDEGAGHDFEFSDAIEIDMESNEHQSLGLSLVNALADEFKSLNNGAHTRLIFSI